MELLKKNIYMNRVKCKSNLQITLDDDFNVPDTKPDISGIIKTSGKMVFDEQKVSNEKLYLIGAFHFTVLYLSAEEGQKVHSIHGQIPFNETIHLNFACSIEDTNTSYEIEDITTHIINSRKLNLKSLVKINASVNEVSSEESAIELMDDKKANTLTDSIDVTNLAVNKKDVYRYHESILLPSGKGNVSDLLYHEIDLKNVETRLLADKFSIKGDLQVFVLYLAEEDDAPIEYYEVELPFGSTIDCNGCTEDMIPDIRLTLLSESIEIKPDADGEERVFDVDAVMDIHICLYEESRLEILSDVYSLQKNLTPVCKETTYENLLLRNSNKIRISDRVKIAEDSPKILQVCHGSGTIKIDEVIKEENSLIIEGVIDANILYISSEDTAPLHSVMTSIPFSQEIDIKGLTPMCIHDVRADLEQINVSMLDNEEVEIKACVVLHTIVFEQFNKCFIVEVTEEPLDYERLQEIPGMIGYLVKPGDTLWKIAKSHYTSVDAIKDLNDLETDVIYPGMHLLLMKEVGPML